MRARVSECLLNSRGASGHRGRGRRPHRGIDHRPHRGNPVRGKTSALGVLADQLLVLREVDAVDLVVGDEAVDPLNVGSENVEGDAGPRRRGVQRVTIERADSGNGALDDVLVIWYLRLMLKS